MTATAAPFGMRPVYHPSGVIRPRLYTIASGYAGNIGMNDPVTLASDGTITKAGTTGDVLGSFQGCEYIDSTGKPVVSNYWPTGTVATGIKAYVVDDPLTIFEMQNAGSVTQTNVGNEANFSTLSMNTTSGLSTTSLSNTIGTSQAQMRIVGFGLGVDNAPGDAYTIVRVQIASSTLLAAKAGV